MDGCWRSARRWLPLVVLALGACTDWNAGADDGGPLVRPIGANGGAPADVAADSTGLVLWETWSPPQADTAAASGADADSFANTDASMHGDAVASDDLAGVLPDVASADGQPEPTDDVWWDAAASDAAPDDAGFVEVWTKDAPASDAKDSWTSDAKDAWAGDTIDAWQPDANDAWQSDAIDAWTSDVKDAWPSDAIDAWTPDAKDAWPSDAIDAWTPDAKDAWVSDADSWPPDSTVDSATADGFVPDWQGYGDTAFPPDADIYGGAISSCLGLYLFQQEVCGVAPSAACIATVAKSGSLWAQYRFEPLATCETAVCAPQCKGAKDKECLEKCVGKYCTKQFFACITNGESGSQDCATTFTCAEQYPDKLLSIGSLCYANASPAAQAQLSGLVSCTGQPQTDSCLDQIAACYGTGPGTASCSETVACMDKCASDPCKWQCLGKASPAAVQLLDSAWDCILQQCQPKCGGDEACMEGCWSNVCKQPLLACLAD